MVTFHEQQEKAVDLLQDWNKWIVGLNFGSATGCMVILQQGATSVIKFFLIGAVIFFALSILASAFIFLVLPEIIQKLPMQKKSQQISVYDYELTPTLTLRTLIGIQLTLFLLGVSSLLIWVLLKN